MSNIISAAAIGLPALTRRGFASSAVAAVAVASVPVAAVAAANSDAELVRLGQELAKQEAVVVAARDDLSDDGAKIEAAAHDELMRLLDLARPLPATTIAGLLVKARVYRLIFGLSPVYTYDVDNGPFMIEPRDAHAFIAEVERIAGATI